MDAADARVLLNWYDRHARVLPWRVGPAARARGVRPDPYAVWLSEVMLQQTTVATVGGRYPRFIARWPDIHALAAADEAAVMGEWAGLGYYARARNLVSCARRVAQDHGGRLPETRAGLEALPGIGPYTGAAIAAIAFDAPEAVVDGNVERVMARLFGIETPLPAAKPELRAAARRLTPRERAGDYAQAVMDLGATICTPRRPDCGRCPWAGACTARALGIVEGLPRRAAKAARPTRTGVVWVGRRADGAWLVEHRPARGILGGMLGWPGSDWDGAAGMETDPHPPAAGRWRRLDDEARHTFTHFHLRLGIAVAELPMAAVPARGYFLPGSAFRPAQLPTLMRKVFDLARGSFDNAVVAGSECQPAPGGVHPREEGPR